MYKNIIVAIENDDTDFKLCERATYFAKAFDAHISLIHALDSSPAVIAPGAGELHAVQASLVQHDFEEYKESVKNRLDELTELAGDSIKSSEVVESSDVRATIHSMALKRDADLIIVGSRGRSGFALFFGGAVANDLLKNAPCDVLAVDIA